MEVLANANTLATFIGGAGSHWNAWLASPETHPGGPERDDRPRG